MLISFNPNISYKTQQKPSVKQNTTFGLKLVHEIKMPKDLLEADDLYYSFGTTIKANDENFKSLDKIYITCKDNIRELLHAIYEDFGRETPKIPNQ